MAASLVTIRVDSDIKDGTSSIAERYGFDPSPITRTSFKQVIRENRIPLNLWDPEPNAESLEAIREADEIIAAGSPGYSSAAEMFRAMGL